MMMPIIEVELDRQEAGCGWGQRSRISFGVCRVWDANYTSQWSQLDITNQSSGLSQAADINWKSSALNDISTLNVGVRLGRE